jgi:hypothetical protein
MRTVHSPPPNAEKIIALVARASALIERVDRDGPKLSPQNRAVIEMELALVKRLLLQLGYTSTA